MGRQINGLMVLSGFHAWGFACLICLALTLVRRGPRRLSVMTKAASRHLQLHRIHFLRRSLVGRSRIPGCGGRLQAGQSSRLFEKQELVRPRYLQSGFPGRCMVRYF